MRHLATVVECATYRSQGMTQQAGQARCRVVQSSGFLAVAHRFGQAENVSGGNPGVALQRGIRRQQAPAGLFFTGQQAMDDQSAAITVEHDASPGGGLRVQRAHPQTVAVADGRIHARTVDLERNGGLLMQQRLDDFAGIGHGRNGVHKQKV